MAKAKKKSMKTAPKKKPTQAALPPQPLRAFGGALDVFKSLIDTLDAPTDGSRRQYHASLLSQAVQDCGLKEGSLLLLESGSGSEEGAHRLVSVADLASELWSGEGVLPAAQQAAQERKPIQKSEAFGALLCVPLLHRGLLQGVLALNRPEHGAAREFDRQELDMIERAAEGLAAALWAARDLSLQTKVERSLTALIAAGAAVIRGRDLGNVLERVISEAQNLMNTEAASVFLLEESSGDLLSPAATGPSGEELKQIRLSAGEGLAGWVAQKGQPIFIDNAQNDPRFATRVDKKTRFKTRNMMVVPMRVDGRIVGVLEVLNKKGGERFSPHELPPLQALADLAAVAVEGARLFDRMQERARMLNQELIQANEEQAEAKTRLESVLFAMEDGVIAADENGRVTLMNRAAQMIIFGLSHQEAMGRLLGEVLPRPEFQEGLRRVRASGEATLLEFELNAPDSRSYAVVITPIKDLEGYLAGLVVVLRDVTRFKELERMKISFLNTVSHELRTPMTSIRAFSELMAGRGGRPVAPEKMSEWAGVIFDEARRLGRLIDDLLDVSRIEAGKRLSINKKVIELRPLFEKTIALFQKDALSHPIQLVLEEHLTKAEVDPDRMEQVLANLLSNAIKYSPQGGVVELRVRFKEPDHFRVEVRDSGLGLSEVDKAHLFEKFYRAESEENIGIGGTGLGLSITKYLIEQHGGSIGVDSELGKGSCFWFEIPIFSPAAP
jgi:two-component system phosphate regulon sensor histidine kinase PhoR